MLKQIAGATLIVMLLMGILFIPRAILADADSEAAAIKALDEFMTTFKNAN